MHLRRIRLGVVTTIAIFDVRDNINPSLFKFDYIFQSEVRLLFIIAFKFNTIIQ